jgi:hypothetical protein
MPNSRKARTNAADSAPGVDDGPAGVGAPPVNSKPSGRGKVWIGVILVCLVVLAAFVFPRLNSGGARGGFVTTGATQADIAGSRVPGTADRQEANQPVTQPAQQPQAGG